MRRLCLFTGGFAAAAGLYLFLLHGAPGVLLAALAAVCALLFLLRRPILRRAAVCVLGLFGRICLVPWVRGAFSAPIFCSFRRNSRVFRAGAGRSAGKQLRAVRLRPADAGRKMLHGGHLL